ncbi:leaf rust 10 disease-resistance locus receptor-like protein kinase-like 2.1 protein [Tanacetum coccineum]
MTKSFLEKLGQGGYESVYKGELPTGELVAVKLLAGAQGDGEDFINEVASIISTSHVNCWNVATLNNIRAVSNLLRYQLLSQFDLAADKRLTPLSATYYTCIA